MTTEIPHYTSSEHAAEEAKRKLVKKSKDEPLSDVLKNIKCVERAKYLEGEGNLIGAAAIAEEAGMTEKAIELYDKAGRFSTAACLAENSGMFETAIKYYEKAGLHSCAEHLAEKVGIVYAKSLDKEVGIAYAKSLDNEEQNIKMEETMDRRAAVGKMITHALVGIGSLMALGVLLSNLPRKVETLRGLIGKEVGAQGTVSGLVERELASYDDAEEKFTYYNLWIKKENVPFRGRNVIYWQKVNFDVDIKYDCNGRQVGIDELETLVEESATSIECKAVKTGLDYFYDDPDKDVFWDEFEILGNARINLS